MRFDGYARPDAAHAYVVNAVVQIAPNAHVAIGSFALEFFALILTGASDIHVLMVEVNEVRAN